MTAYTVSAYTAYTAEGPFNFFSSVVFFCGSSPGSSRYYEHLDIYLALPRPTVTETKPSSTTVYEHDDI